jgi:hypothetical protein
VNPDGTYTYVPNPGFVGVDTFQIKVTAPDGSVAFKTEVWTDVSLQALSR